MHPPLGEGGCSAQRKWKVCGARRPRLGSSVRTCCWARATETPHAEPAAFFLSASWGGVLLVSPPPSPPPRGESARGSAAAAIFPPFRTHGAWGRSAAAPPPPVPGLGKGPPCRCHPLASAAAFAGLQDPAYATAPVRADRRFRLRLLFPLLRSPRPGSRFAGDAARAPSGPGKSLGARACACAADPSSSSLRARAPFGCAPAPPGGREGRWRPRLQEGRTSSLVCPLEGRPRKGGGQAGE